MNTFFILIPIYRSPAQNKQTNKRPIPYTRGIIESLEPYKRFIYHPKAVKLGKEISCSLDFIPGGTIFHFFIQLLLDVMKHSSCAIAHSLNVKEHHTLYQNSCSFSTSCKGLLPSFNPKTGIL